MNEAAENVSTTGIVGTGCRWVEERRARGSQIEPAMWTVGVVVPHVGVQEMIEVSTAQDERPVNELSPNRSEGHRGRLWAQPYLLTTRSGSP